MQEARSAPELFRNLFSHLSARRRKQLGLLLGLMLVGSLAEIVTIGAVVPFISLMARPETAMEFPFLQDLFAAIGWRQSQSLVLPMSIAFVCVVLAATGIRLLLVYVSNKLVFAIGHDIGLKLYHVILHQPYAFHISQNTSEVLGNINKVQIVVGGVLRPLMDGMVAIILSVAIFAALMLVDATTALTAGVLFALIYVGIMKLFRTRLRRNGKVIATAQGKRMRCIQEGLGGIRDVILDGNQAYYSGEFSKVDRQFRNAQAANVFFSQSPRFLVEAIGIGLIVALAYSLTLKTGGLLGALPVLAALVLGAQRLLPLLQKVYQAWSTTTGNLQVLDDLVSMLDLATVQRGYSRSQAGVMSFEDRIDFKGLNFHYAEDEPEVLSDINLTIPKGSRVGIVGKTGSGKSTLMDILMGLLEPTGGRIRVDGKAIDAENQNYWRQRIAHVPQHIYLSDASITENIALGVSPERIDMDRVRRAAHQAQIAEFIESHRQGYDTRVGERGVQLSGGQRQRIGIARALYKEADVLVFDEASSALDTETETAVMQAVSQLDPNLTLFIIAHRVQTLRECDLILRLEDGHLVSAGSYEEVIGAQPRQAAADIRN